MRIDGFSPLTGRGRVTGPSYQRRVEGVREEGPDLRGRDGQIEPPAAQLQDRDPLEERALPFGVRGDVALSQGGDREPARGTVLEQALDEGARVVAQMAAGAGVERELGEGRCHSGILGGAPDQAG